LLVDVVQIAALELVVVLFAYCDCTVIVVEELAALVESRVL
jgi:hypothetical protein